MTDELKDDFESMQHYARNLFNENEYQNLLELRQRCLEKHGEFLGQKRVLDEFERFFWRDRKAVREWAQLRPELRARRVKQFERAMEKQSRRAIRDHKERQRRSALSRSAELPGSRAPRPELEVRRTGDDTGTYGFTVEKERPLNRLDCPPYRPCPYVSCRYNLFLDVTRRGRLRLNFPKKDIIDLQTTCALDVAAEGPKTLEQIGRIMGGISRERVRQIEQAALQSLRKRGGDVLVEFLSERLAEEEMAARAREASDDEAARSTG